MKKQNEPYLKIPAHILNPSQIGLCEKALLAYIYSFGVKGCWQNNEMLAQIFMVSQRTIERWLAAIKQFVFVRNGKGDYRTIWAKSHPQVASAKNGVRVRQNCRTTINNTITENNKRTIASPSPSGCKTLLLK